MRLLVRVREHAPSPLSRSQAKRLVKGFESHEEVVLDFREVEHVGQGFVDQVFRVWALQYPDVRLVPEGMNPAVEFMVRRGMPKGDGRGRQP